MPSVLDRDALEQSPLADLHLLANELGVDGFRRLRKADLVDAILARQAGGGGGARRRPRRKRRPRGAPARAVAAAPAPRSTRTPTRTRTRTRIGTLTPC